MAITNGTEKQIAFAIQIRAALLKRIVDTRLVPADKIDAFATHLDANSPADAAKWIETAKSINTTGQIVGDDGSLNCDPRKFLPAISK